jgi:hypothetical protein
MAELTNSLLEKLIDCQESDMPSPWIVQLMASEIMRIRSYGEMIPAPDSQLRHRCVMLMSNLKAEQSLDGALSRMSDLAKPKLKLDMKQTLIEALQFVAGDDLADEDGEWVSIAPALLEESDRMIHDAVGFGTSHDHKMHNNTLNNLRKFIENSHGTASTLVPRELISQMSAALGEIVYGKQFSMDERERLIERLDSLLSLGAEDE